ncbi:Hypothetical_protein [Hexamita inflata]|uniref:Hypothetical_protein n=1 Tax=Hexamita inflata TaxID=28002 RepID=A0ABP1JU54_9EUKA
MHHKIKSYRIFLRSKAILIQIPINCCHSLIHKANTERTKSFENNIFHIENSTIIARLYFNNQRFSAKTDISDLSCKQEIKTKKIDQVHSACLGRPKSRVEIIYSVSVTNLLLITLINQQRFSA